MNVMSELKNFSVIRNHLEQKFTVMLRGVGGVYLVNGLTSVVSTETLGGTQHICGVPRNPTPTP